MPLMKLYLLLTFLCLCPAVLNADNAAGNSAYNIRFGLVQMDENGLHSISKETKVIPYKIGENVLKFGYEISRAEGSKSYLVHYVLHLPSPPKQISDALATTNPGPPTATVLSPKREVPGIAFVDYLWFDEGDPVGDYSIDVFVDDVLIKTIKFEVKKE